MGEGNFVELSSYKRLKHFTYFKTLEYPFIGLTCEVDITYFYNWTKAKEKPFFLSFLWCVGRAANKIREFRQRIRKGKYLSISIVLLLILWLWKMGPIVIVI